jgi:hypothetical protein
VAWATARTTGTAKRRKASHTAVRSRIRHSSRVRITPHASRAEPRAATPAAYVAAMAR